MKDMHIEGFATALAAFDDALDEFTNRQMSDIPHSYGWAATEEPLIEGKNYTISRVYPATSDLTCDCGGTSTCARKSKPKVCFDDILDDVRQVIYNDPATIVTFSDGSKVCVKACSKDTFNKETGLIYAIIKRLYANDVEDNTGYLRSKGLGEKISKIINKSIDQKEAERVRRRKQKNAKKREAAKKTAKKGETAKRKDAEKVSEQA